MCDPLGARDSINLYRYLSRSPTIARDGTGKQTELFTSVDMLRKLIPTPPIEQLVDRQTRVPWTITTPTGSPTVGIALNLSTRAGPPGQIEVSGNPGHAVLYARDANGSAMILSFGPRPFLSPLDGMTWNGERPRPPDPLYKIERTDEYQVYEFRVSLDQLKKAEDFIKKFSANPLGYSIGTNCTTVVVQGAKQSGIPVPEGEGMIVYRGLHQGVAPNPVALDEQLRARGAVTTTRNANTFFGDVLNPVVDVKGASKITASSVPAQDWGDGGRGSRSRRSAAEVK